MTSAGLGSHFKEVLGNDLDIVNKAKLDASWSLWPLRPPANYEEQQACQARLDRLEVDLQYRLRCLDEHGGMNVRDENHRRRGQ